ncbi:zf-HC2 domain-containing protein [Micromonospora sp. NPDC049900]|uniref:zf-HC2 domain-containing protein n=1 Tax=Micromonospora sp. NPDC049900 TaxID=3364275 RepID=UPI0037A9793C
MTDLHSDHAAARQTCALYLAGALDPVAEAAFEVHLASCTECLDECDRVGPVALALAQLDDEPSDLDPHPTPGSVAVVPTDTAPTDAPTVAPAPRSGEVDDQSGARPTSTGPQGRTAPTGPRGARPATTRRRFSRRLRLAAGALAATVVLAGALAVGLPRLTGEPTVVTPVGVATAEGVGGGSARLSVSIAETDGRSTIVASVVGLETGVRYRLFGVTRDGQTHEVVEWDGRPGAQEISGELDTTLAELTFFTVARMDGGPVVSARLDPVTPTPTD